MRYKCIRTERAKPQWIFHIVSFPYYHDITPLSHTIITSLFSVLSPTISRYAPFLPKQNMIFPVDGIHVTKEYNCDHERCNISLDNLSMDSSGSYRCEVSGDAPEFRIVHDTSNMTVIGECFFFSYTISLSLFSHHRDSCIKDESLPAAFAAPLSSSSSTIPGECLYESYKRWRWDTRKKRAVSEKLSGPSTW